MRRAALHLAAGREQAHRRAGIPLQGPALRAARQPPRPHRRGTHTARLCRAHHRRIPQAAIRNEPQDRPRGRPPAARSQQHHRPIPPSARAGAVHRPLPRRAGFPDLGQQPADRTGSRTPRYRPWAGRKRQPPPGAALHEIPSPTNWCWWRMLRAPTVAAKR